MNQDFYIVTGGAGFIGSSIVRNLVKKNFNVIVIDNLSTGKLENLKEVKNRIHFFESDICEDLSFLKNYKSIKAVFHLAALPSVAYSVENPVETNHINLFGTLNILEYARHNNIKKFIFSASSAAYGNSDILPNVETAVSEPQSPYAVQKVSSEYYVKLYSQLYGIDTVCLRYFNVFGPGQNPESEYAAVIPKFILKSLNNEVLTVFGDGNQTRDFIFVEDVANANIRCLEYKTSGETINIATGKSINLNELIKKISIILNKKLNVNYSEARSGDVIHSAASIKKAFDIIQFKPDYSLDKALEETIRWFKTNENI
ncbi:MAG: NAD-dependent epimerase/dehydratase family protein [Candidatus Muiribacteriota bacterium]